MKLETYSKNRNNNDGPSEFLRLNVHWLKYYIYYSICFLINFLAHVSIRYMKPLNYNELTLGKLGNSRLAQL